MLFWKDIVTVKMIGKGKGGILIPFFIWLVNMQQYMQCNYNVISKCFRVNMVAVEKQ